MNKGWPVACVMCSLAFAFGSRDPITFVWLASVARFVYGFDRFEETDDSAESVALAFAVSVATLHARGLFVLAPVQSVVAQTYPVFKRRFALLKPFYVGVSWACTTSVVPRKMENRAFNESEFGGMFLLATAVSNHADISDSDEDARNGIHTFPVRYGRRCALVASTASAAAALYIFTSQRFRTPFAKTRARNSPIQCNIPRVFSPSRSLKLAKSRPSVVTADAPAEILERTVDVRDSVGICTPSASTGAENRYYRYSRQYDPHSFVYRFHPRPRRSTTTYTRVTPTEASSQRDAKCFRHPKTLPTRPRSRRFAFRSTPRGSLGFLRLKSGFCNVHC